MIAKTTVKEVLPSERSEFHVSDGVTTVGDRGQVEKERQLQGTRPFEPQSSGGSGDYNIAALRTRDVLERWPSW